MTQKPPVVIMRQTTTATEDPANVLLLFVDLGLSADGPNGLGQDGTWPPELSPDCRGWNGCCAITGCALVSEEVWKHPTAPGSDCVVYHEAVGHGNGAPHPAAHHRCGVMGAV